VEDLETLKKQLAYESQHRGMRELDLLLGEFAQRVLPSMGEAELKEFQELLTFSDDDLYGWFFEKTKIPENAPHSLIKAILSRKNYPYP
jgi:succinate dehydrogenase flavin-adding protein (antitoxin of CptAB toxin-antitoxin module)